LHEKVRATIVPVPGFQADIVLADVSLDAVFMQCLGRGGDVSDGEPMRRCFFIPAFDLSTPRVPACGFMADGCPDTLTSALPGGAEGGVWPDVAGSGVAGRQAL